MRARFLATLAAIIATSLAASAQEPAPAGVIPSNLRGVGAAGTAPGTSVFYTLPEAPQPDASLLGTMPETNADAKDLHKFDEPRDAILQPSSPVMSKYIVQAARVPEFRLRDVYTVKGLEELGFRDHPGLRAGNFFHDNDPQAYEMFLDDERLSNIRDLTDTALAMTVGGDKAEGDVILRAERQTYNREERSDPLQSWEDIPHNKDGTPLIVNLEQVRATLIHVRF